MSARPRLFQPDSPLSSEPKHFTRIPDDIYEDRRLSHHDQAVLAALLNTTLSARQVSALARS